MVMKYPNMKDDCSRISAIVSSDVFEMPIIRVPMVNMTVIITEISRISKSLELMNSALLIPLMIFCRIVLNVNSLVISIIITIAGKISTYRMVAKNAIFCHIHGKK
jgi:hypothetical protein